LALPEDMLVETAAVEDGRPAAAVQAAPSPAAMDELRRLLEEAKRPFAILGGGGWSEAGTTALASFLDASDLPAACGFRRQDLLDNEHRCYAGHLGLGPNPKLVERVRGSDLLLVIGSRLGETTSQGFTLPDLPRPRQRLVHVHPDPEELGRYYQPDLAILSSLDAFAIAAAAMPPPRYHAWATTTAEAHAEELAWRTPTRIPGALQLGEVVAWLRAQLPAGAILTNGAGNYAIWANRHFGYRGLGTQLAPTSGSMGYGLPAAVAAKLRHPDRPVVCFAGDGCFLMTGQELATAVQYDLPIIIVVVDNGMYGTIRMHQERDHPGRVSGTALRNPDFAALALAYGAHGARVETTEAFAPAFEKAVASGKPALLHLILDPEAITPRMSLSELTAAARAKSG
jgi:acetolactate synthase-1/2/3 large subunit